MNQAFTAERRARQDTFAESVLPLVKEALASGDWTEALAKAHQLYLNALELDSSDFATDDELWLGLAKALAEVFTKTNEESDALTTALMIAVSVINVGAMETARQRGMQVEWVTMHDKDVRDTHDAAEGQRRDPGEAFLVGDFPMPYPGFMGAPIELWINCRCTLRPVSAKMSLSADAVVHNGQESSQGAEMTDNQWHGVLAPEGVRSGDGRMFKEGSLRARELPLPLTWQKVSDDGHQSNVVVATIERMERVGNEIRSEGSWLDIPEAVEARNLAIKFGRFGVSIDADDIDQSALSIELGDDGRELLTFSDGRVCSACMVSIPAFQEAYVADGAAEDDFWMDPETEAQGAALTAGGWAAPSEWFKRPEHISGGINFSDDDQRTFGYLAEFGICHIGFDGACIMPPHTTTDYALFATGEIITSDGERVRVGALTIDTGHADGLLGLRPAAAHYDNTGSVWAYVALGEDEHGIWYSGMVKPGTTEDTINTARAAGRLSGDWRDFKGELELIAALTVNVPGFVIESPRAMVAGGVQVSLVAAGLVPFSQGEVNVTVGISDEQKQSIAAAVVAELRATEERTAQMAALRDKVGSK